MELNPKHVKALYRSARALFVLERVDEAKDCCEHALIIDPDNNIIEDFKQKIIKRKEQLEAKQKAKEEKERKEKEEKEKLEQAFKVTWEFIKKKTRGYFYNMVKKNVFFFFLRIVISNSK